MIIVIGGAGFYLSQVSEKSESVQTENTNEQDLTPHTKEPIVTDQATPTPATGEVGAPTDNVGAAEPSALTPQPPPQAPTPSPQQPTPTPPTESPPPAPQPPPPESPPTPPPPPEPTTEQYTIGADDYGYYQNGQTITSLTVGKGNTVQITFQVSATKVYYGGLDFRGCGQNTATVPPGGSIQVSFTADTTCTISSYWPTSGVLKASLLINVQ